VTAVSSLLIPKMMKTTPQAIIGRGVWRGLRKLYNAEVDSGYTTLIVSPGKDVRQRSIETKEIFQ
jgi:hypothetical protein